MRAEYTVLYGHERIYNTGLINESKKKFYQF